jgi:hypothetical protein
MKQSKTTAEKKEAILQVCDAESYLSIIKASLSEEQTKAHSPIHLANILALTAELYLLYYDSIGSSFATSHELALALTCKIGASKDTVEISWLPVAKFKDSASATVEDESQPDLGDIKKEAKSYAPKPARIGHEPPVVVVEAEPEFQEITDEEIKEFVMSLDNMDEEYEPEKIGQFEELYGIEALERAMIYAEGVEISFSTHTELVAAVANLKHR